VNNVETTHYLEHICLSATISPRLRSHRLEQQLKVYSLI